MSETHHHSPTDQCDDHFGKQKNNTTPFGMMWLSVVWMVISTCITRPSFLMRSLPSLVHGAGSSSSRFSRYRQTKKPDLPLAGQYFATWKQVKNTLSKLSNMLGFLPCSESDYEMADLLFSSFLKFLHTEINSSKPKCVTQSHMWLLTPPIGQMCQGSSEKGNGGRSYLSKFQECTSFVALVQVRPQLAE